MSTGPETITDGLKSCDYSTVKFSGLKDKHTAHEK